MRDNDELRLRLNSVEGTEIFSRPEEMSYWSAGRIRFEIIIPPVALASKSPSVDDNS